MDLINTILAVVLVINIGLAMLIYYHGQNKVVKFWYSAMILVVSLWTLSIYFYRLVHTESQSLFWCKILYFVASFTSTTFLFFSESFPDGKNRLNRYSRIIIIIWNIALGIAILTTDLFVSNVVIRPGQEKLILWGPLYWIYLPHILVFFMWAYYHLYFEKYRKLTGLAKKQTLFVFWGFFISGNIAFATNLSLPSFGITSLNWLGQVVTIAMLGATAYTILRLHLLNIRLIVTESVSYILLVVLTIDIFLSRSLREVIFKIVIAIIFTYFSFILIRSVKKEVQQRKEVERLATELRDANDKLKQVDAMKTEFISMASHELLTPISAIEGYLSMMLDEHMVKIEDPKARQYMESVYKSSKRLARLVTDLLNVSRIEQGRMLVEKKETDLEMLIDEVMKELKFKAEEKHHELMAQIRDGVNTKIYADEDKIKEVIINLTGNSIKYTKDGGKIGIGVDVWPTSEVEKRFSKMQTELKEHAKTTEGALQTIVDEKFAQLVGDKQIIVLVKDTGIGITREDIGHLFQKFSRVGDWSTQEVQGTGLGLYISRALVEMHHGRIWVESEGEGKGSTFYFSLPTIESEAEEKKLDAEVPVAKDAKPLAKPAAQVTG